MSAMNASHFALAAAFDLIGKSGWQKGRQASCGVASDESSCSNLSDAECSTCCPLGEDSRQASLEVPIGNRLEVFVCPSAPRLGPQPDPMDLDELSDFELDA